MSSGVRQVPSRRRLVVASERDRSSIEGTAIEHLVFFFDADARTKAVLQDIFPLLAVAFSDAAEADLKQDLAAIRSLGTIPDVPLQRLDAKNGAQSCALIAALLEGGVGRLSSFTASVTSELAMLRRERETLLENYRALENAFQARNWEPVAEIFAHDPYVDPRDEGIGHLLATAGVEQLLPVSSHGVAGIALHMHSVPKDGGELVVSLSYVETGEGVAEWVVPFRDLAADWNYLALPQSCGGGGKTLRLRISAGGAETVGLSLGHPIASERYTASSEHPHPDLDLRPLAFRVYTGVPGVKPSPVPNMIAPTALLDGQFIEDYRLPIDLLRQIIDVSVSPIVPEFQTIRFLEHENAVVCHPLPSGISAGAIIRAVEPGTTSFSASAVIDHSEGAPAAVSLLLAPANSNPRAEVAEIARRDSASPTTFFSGWREVGPDSPVNINMQLDEPLSGPMDLMILSRAVGESVDFSWLKVSGFRLVKQSVQQDRREALHV
ncbi:DUF6212 domain-containing protein [Nitratireductor sp. ZSWI3]|uniref:DUF6212 domain-containing protein n=1 Tax=Nitratireductor sp. ZSWI3 TaxID=2966359 RepID=UPI00214F9C88|nr:DUF6212 domain-containing protein [Nitratireductor sp. ZSWI3]MCR4266983.1 DUF6212 domain-containing protein [Nitratireductor sp. ZSWI3]